MCLHEKFAAACQFERVGDRVCLEISVMCAICGCQFQFLGLPHGIDMHGASVSQDGMRATLGMASVAEEVRMLDASEAGLQMIGWLSRKLGGRQSVMIGADPNSLVEGEAEIRPFTESVAIITLEGEDWMRKVVQMGGRVPHGSRVYVAGRGVLLVDHAVARRVQVGSVWCESIDLVVHQAETLEDWRACGLVE